jgi:sugar transferase (PEP-CTERM/EpsH1 system associated)
MKILVVLSRVPYPLEKGDKLRAYNHIRYLSKNNEVVLFALYKGKIHPDAEKELKKYCASTYFFKMKTISIFFNVLKAFLYRKPIQTGYFYSKIAQKTLDKIVRKENPDRIFCQLIRVAEYVKSYSQKKILDYQDALSVGMQRRMEKTFGLWRWFFRIEWKRLKRYENKVFNSFDEKIIISKPDQKLMPHKDRDCIKVIPNGVDTSFFKPIEREKKYDLVFIGNMSYGPNIHAVRYLVKVVLPVVKKSRNNIRLLIAGSSPHSSITALANDYIDVSGWVDDIRESYAQSKVFIAPMQLGTGLQNKLLEAMAMGLPCITSLLANDALAAEENKEILIGRTPEEYSWNINMLLDDKEKYQQIAENGHKYVVENYQWDTLSASLEEIITNPHE